jgi:ATP-dependent exoDNAse (exonuclease V) beta subunit
LVILNKEQIRNILTKPEEKCEVKNELKFAAIINEKLTNGTFDRVAFFPDSSLPERVEIYDYKSDALCSDEEIKTAVDNYTPQINCYKKAVAKGYNLDKNKIKTRLVFTSPGKVIDV